MFDKEFEQIFDIAKKKNIQKFDVFLTQENSFSVKSFRQKVESFKYADSIGLGIRVVIGNSAGYAYTEKLDKQSLETTMVKAKENAEYIETDDIIEFENYPDIEKKLEIFHPEIEKVNVKEKIEKVKLMEKSAHNFDKKVVNVPYNSIGNDKMFTKIANSKGLQKEYVGNAAYGYAMCLAQGGKETKSGYFFKISDDFSKINSKEIGEESAKKALELLGAQEIKSGKYPVIFNNEMGADILSTFSNIFSAKAVQDGLSLLKGKLKSKIANDIVSISDDALLKNGFSTRPFDDEGYPSQTTEIISNGTLQSYLHNSITAKKDKTKSTGNASRSYKSTVTISPSNFFIKNGTSSEKDLYKFYPKCVEIVSLSGLHSGCNSISGDFSIGAEGFYYENGERKYPVHNFTISGNFFQLLQNIIAIGNNLKFNMNSIGSPSILIKTMDISG